MRGRKPDLKVIDGGLDHVPDMPAHIPSDMAGEWRGILTELTDRKVLTEAMHGTVDAYVLAMWNARLAQKEIAAHGLLVQSGKEGVLKQNPAVSLLCPVGGTKTYRMAYQMVKASRRHRSFAGCDDSVPQLRLDQLRLRFAYPVHP